MFVFTGFNTMSGIQTLIFNSATKEHSGGFVPGFQGNGFIDKERSGKKSKDKSERESKEKSENEPKTK